MEDADRFKLKELIEELEKYKGRHTELISVYVPAGYNLNLIATQIETEKGTASNIKSKSTRKNVIDALERIARHFKLYKLNPPNGLAVFCGNVAKQEGIQDIKLWAIEPPFELKIKVYRCDQTFLLDPLKEMLESTEVYGLIAIERKEATIGLLEGKIIKVLKKLTSGVPGKVRAGGQCLSQDTLIMKDDGNIIEIRDSHNPLVILSENFNKEEIEETPLIAKWGNKKQILKISTCCPKIEIKASLDHLFFVRTENGLEEKPLSKIKEGDYLVMPEKINLSLSDQEINFIPEIKYKFNIKEVNIPKKINPEFSKILGYYLGDGCYEIDRLTFFEQREEVAEYYKNLLEQIFGIEVKHTFRRSKNYHQLRIYSRIIAQLFKQIFSEKEKTLNEKIPSIILKSSNKSLASFISGFFDAEGYVVKTRIALGINNEFLARQIQFVLLRLGIIASLGRYDNRRNPYSSKIKYTISIEDLESLKKFKELIGFSSIEKQNKLNGVIRNRSNKNKIRQIVVNGKDIAKILRNAGLNTTQFGCPDFFTNKKQLSKEIFKKKILDKIQSEELKRRLTLFYRSNLIAVKISKIEKLEEDTTIDIETKNHNFIANGLIVHNSAARFSRITESMAKEFYRRVAESAKQEFFEMKKLKGILLGGPGPTKEDFLKEGELPTSLKEKIIAIKDIGYADEFGLQMLVEASADVLAQQEITKEKQLLQSFFLQLATRREKVTYGFEEVKKALEIGAAEKIIISSVLPKEKIDELINLAKATNASVEIVSTETGEGIEFKNMGGVGAFLRFQFKFE